MLKGNQYQIWFLYSSIDLMKVVWGLENWENLFGIQRGETKGEHIFSFGPPFGCKKKFPESSRPQTTFIRSIEPYLNQM